MNNELLGLLVLVASASFVLAESIKFSQDDLDSYRDRVKQMFYHAYDNYIYHAYPYDELKPITCKGFDTWGSYSLTLVDSLDMLIILGNKTEFERVTELLEKSLDPDKDINVSVFETNIRVIGGLLSAHLLSYRLYVDESDSPFNVSNHLHPEWPCNGPLLRLAIKFADKLLPAFNTPTGMPYGTVNLKKGVPPSETTETCVAGVGTFIVEFATLSRLTGDPTYENAAMRAMDALWSFKSQIDLIGNHIKVDTGAWAGVDATIGSGVDSYFEYLVKAGILLNKPELVEQFRVYQRAINKHLYVDNWFFWANMQKGQKTLPLFSSLEAFYPGLLTLTGDLDQAVKLVNSYHQLWRQYGSLPEFFNVQANSIHSNREAYPLRPELIESVMYLLRATNNDETYLEMAVDYLNSIDEISKLNCGFATVKDIKDHKLEDRMESFFLAETLKYLYLIFDNKNFLHNDISSNSYRVIENQNGQCAIETGLFVFNTEAHPIDGGSLECCRVQRGKQASLDETVNLSQLVDRYLSLKSVKNTPVVDHLSSLRFKNMRDEFKELRDQMANELRVYDLRNHCESSLTTSNNNLNISTDFFDDKTRNRYRESAFTCSMNNTFRLATSFLNQPSYFP